MPVCVTQRGPVVRGVSRTAGVCPPRAVHFASVYMCERVYVCCLDLSVSGIPSPEHTLWFYYRSMFAVRLLCRLAWTCPAQGRGVERTDVGSWGRGGQAPSPHLGAQTLGSPVGSGRPQEAKGWAPGCGRVCPSCSPLWPWLPRGDRGVTATTPHRDLRPPSPNSFCLRRSRPAQTCLLALSCREQIPSRGLWRAGECWSLLGGPQRLSPARIPPPTPGSHFSGFRPDVATFARDPLNR